MQLTIFKKLLIMTKVNLVHLDFKYLIEPNNNQIYHLRAKFLKNELTIIKIDDKSDAISLFPLTGILKIIKKHESFLLSYSNVFAFLCYFIFYKSLIKRKKYTIKSYLVFPSTINPVLITEKILLNQENINIVSNVLYSLTPEKRKKYMIPSSFLSSKIYSSYSSFFVKAIFILFSKRIYICKKI